MSIVAVGEGHPRPLLNSLGLSKCRKLTDMSLLRISKGCPNLLSLDVSSNFCGITDIGIISVAEGFPNLLSLNVSQCDITDDCIIRLAECCPKLQILNLSYNDITDIGIICLAERCRNFFQNVEISPMWVS